MSVYISLSVAPVISHSFELKYMQEREKKENLNFKSDETLRRDLFVDSRIENFTSLSI